MSTALAPPPAESQTAAPSPDYAALVESHVYEVHQLLESFIGGPLPNHVVVQVSCSLTATFERPTVVNWGIYVKSPALHLAGVKNGMLSAHCWSDDWKNALTRFQQNGHPQTIARGLMLQECIERIERIERALEPG